MKRHLARLFHLACVSLCLTAAAPAGVLSLGEAAAQPAGAAQRYVGLQPDPLECADNGFRCFGPQAIQRAYDLLPLYARGLEGQGQTIAIVDSFGSNTIDRK